MQLTRAAAAGTDRITIKLQPENLGKVDIELKFNDGRVTATITADTPEAVQHLQRDSQVLEKALQDAGLQTDRDSLQFNMRGEQRQGGQANDGQGRRGGRERGQFIGQDDLAPVPTAAQQARAAAGGVDISV